MNQYKKSIQWTNAMNLYKESIQCPPEPMNQRTHINSHPFSSHQVTFSKKGLESHCRDLPLWIPIPPKKGGRFMPWGMVGEWRDGRGTVRNMRYTSSEGEQNRIQNRILSEAPHRTASRAMGLNHGLGIFRVGILTASGLKVTGNSPLARVRWYMTCKDMHLGVLQVFHPLFSKRAPWPS